MRLRVEPWHHASPARRGIVAWLAAGSLWRGIAYCLPPESPHAPAVEGGVVEVLALHGPLWILGAGWLIAGIIAAVSAIIGRWVIATTVVGAAWLSWGLAYAVAWAIPGWGQGQDWISAGTYLTTAGVILTALLVREQPRVVEEG